ncbi:hypothetical protein [Erwinia psidii]|nr:hypothetical protein [Erwinia psidii]
MFEIKTDDTLFRFTFIERLEEPEDRRYDLIMCWLETEGSGISLACECEFSLFDLEELRDKLSYFYQLLSENKQPSPITWAPRVPTFNIDIISDDNFLAVGFNFKITPNILTRWTLEGGTLIDQTYFPDLIRGIDSILTN